MKKIFTMIMLALLALPVAAQDDQRFQFVDAEGKTVENGSVVVVTAGETDNDGFFVMPSGLYVKNVSGTSDAYLRVNYNLTQLDNGSYQICFPSSCVNKTAEGSYQTSAGTMQEGETRDLMTEWFAEEKGECVVELTIETLTSSGGFPVKYEHQGYGSTVTLKFIYDPASAVNAISADNAAVASRYTIDGRQLSQPSKGINIVKLANGKVKKILVK